MLCSWNPDVANFKVFFVFIAISIWYDTVVSQRQVGPSTNFGKNKTPSLINLYDSIDTVMHFAKRCVRMDFEIESTLCR